MNGMEWIIGALAFGGELVLWYGVGRVAFLAARGYGTVPAWLAAIVAVAVVIVAWSIFLAPRADRRLELVPRVTLIVLCTVLTGVLLYRLGDHTLGWVVGLGATVAIAFGQVWMK